MEESGELQEAATSSGLGSSLGNRKRRPCGAGLRLLRRGRRQVPGPLRHSKDVPGSVGNCKLESTTAVESSVVSRTESCCCVVPAQTGKGRPCSLACLAVYLQPPLLVHFNHQIIPVFVIEHWYAYVLCHCKRLVTVFCIYPQYFFLFPDC